MNSYTIVEKEALEIAAEKWHTGVVPGRRVFGTGVVWRKGDPEIKLPERHKLYVSIAGQGHLEYVKYYDLSWKNGTYVVACKRKNEAAAALGRLGGKSRSEARLKALAKARAKVKYPIRWTELPGGRWRGERDGFASEGKNKVAIRASLNLKRKLRDIAQSEVEKAIKNEATGARTYEQREYDKAVELISKKTESLPGRKA